MKDENLIIDVHDLCKSFDKIQAVINMTIQVRRGQICGFLGPNGSGKTTTMRMLCGLLRPDSGSGTCLGYNILTDTKLIKRHVGYIPQFFGLYKELTVYENLMFIAELYGLVDRRKKVLAMIDQLGLGTRMNQKAGTLSGGWKQRLALAAALIHEPFLLILDEPTANVDPNLRADFWEHMHSLSSEGMTILLSSHSMNEIEHCHQIIYILNGRLLFSGQINEIIKKINLHTWKIQGLNLNLLAKQLQATPGIEQVVTFFDTLHVSSQNKEVLDKAILPFLKNPNFVWTPCEASLDDIFIWLSRRPYEKKTG